MTEKRVNWRGWATAGFLILLALNVVLCAAALGTAVRGDHPWSIIPEESPPALRLLAFLVGAGAAWIAGRLMLETLVMGHVAIVKAVTGAWSIVFYLMLLFIGVAFVGAIHWGFLLVLLIIVLFYSVPALWELLGAMRAGLILVVCLLAGGVTFYLAARA